MKRLVSVFLLLCFIGLTSAAQPKILEIEDNLGNTYDFSEYQDTTSIGGLSPDKKISVTENTTISLCVTKVKAQNPDNLTYEWRAVRPNVEPASGQGEQSNKCETWNLEREDYRSYWTFRVEIDNGDEIQPNGDSDYMGGVRYDNLELAGSGGTTTIEEFQTIQVEKERWEEKQEELEEKDQRINELQQRISELEDRIDELTSQANQSEAEGDNSAGPPERVTANQDNDSEDLPGNQQADENRPGFVNSLLDSIFG